MIYKAYINKGSLTIKQKPTLLMTIIDRLRLAKLDPKHRKLSKYLLEDEHQQPTDLAKEMVMEDFLSEAWKQKRDGYLDALTKMEKEEKAEKSGKSSS